jgi:hypothetical protein
MDPIALLVVWGLTCLIGLIVGNNRGQPGTGFALALLFGPLGLFAAATLPLSMEAMIREEAQRASARNTADLRARADRARTGGR